MQPAPHGTEDLRHEQTQHLSLTLRAAPVQAPHTEHTRALTLQNPVKPNSSSLQQALTQRQQQKRQSASAIASAIAAAASDAGVNSKKRRPDERHEHASPDVHEVQEIK